MAKASNRFALWLTIGRIFSMLVTFAMPLIMTRVLSQSDYGIFSQYFTLYMSLHVMFALGFHSNLFYYYPTAGKSEKDEYVSNTLFLLLLMSLFAVLILSIPFVHNHVYGNGELSQYSLLVTMSIALTIPINIVGPLFTVREDKWGAVIYPGASALLRLLTVTLAASIKNDLHTVFVALVLYQTIILIWVLIYSLKNHTIKLNNNKIKAQVLYSLPFGLTVALQLFSNYYDKIVCIRYLDTVQYAIYGIAFMSIPGINQIYDSLCQVNVVNMTKSYQEGDMFSVREMYRDFVVKTLSFSTPIILAVAVFSEEIFSFLYPQEYLHSAHYFRIYSLTFLTAMLGAGTIMRALGRTYYSLVSYTISAIIGLPLTLVLIRSYGIDGAIWGAVNNLVLPRIIQMIFESRQVNSSLSNYLPWRKILIVLTIGIILLIPLIIIKLFLSPSLFICILSSGLYVLLSYYLLIKLDLFLLSKSAMNRFLARYSSVIIK